MQHDTPSLVLLCHTEIIAYASGLGQFRAHNRVAEFISITKRALLELEPN